MPPSKQTDIAQQLASLQAEFKRSLPEKISELELLWNLFLQDEGNDSAINGCHRMAHSLVGSGGTFGAVIVSTASRELEHTLSLLIHDENSLDESKSIINDLILKLKDADDSWQPSDIPYLPPLSREPEPEYEKNSKLIYLVEDDELLAADLLIKLKEDGFNVIHFSALTDFIEKFHIKKPSAIIMDIAFKEGRIAGAETLAKLKKENILPPLVFISVHDDMEVRLAAARVGAQRYFCKPVDIKTLTKTLHGLLNRFNIAPYKILLVDDDMNMLKYYKAVLSDAGMEVKTISNPLVCLDMLNKFKPDVMIFDLYMPECSGPELAQVVRQNNKWAMTPIMFLSAEDNIEVQLNAMNLGGESFMVKPVSANHLVGAVKAKAEKSRWNYRLTDDLKLAVRESEYQVITSNKHNIMSSADVAGRIISVNDKFCEISGYNKKELIGQNHRLLKSDYHPESFYKDIWNTIASGEVWHGTICNLNKEGKEYWVDSTIVPFLDEKGKPYKYVSARTDITLVLQSEERLERSQEFANIGTWDWDIKTGKLFWSDRIWSLFGFDKETTEITYDNFMDAIHKDDRAFVGVAVTKCVELGEEYNIEHRVVWPDGSIHWLHESGDVVRNKEDQPLHMLGVVQDITNRKKIEIALSERERQLISAQSMAGVGNWQADLSNGELIWSDEIYRIFGYEPGSFTPSVEAFHQAIHPDDQEMVLESEKQAEKTGTHDVEHRILQPNGAVRYVHELAKAELDGDGHLIRMSGTVQDITERKISEQSIILAREEAETANRAKSQFLSSMSHELRTPMNAIMGFGQLLEMEFDNPLSISQKENVAEIMKASDHLLDLINEVLDLAKIEAGRIDLSIEDVTVESVMTESLQLILPLADKRGISVKFICDNADVDLNGLMEGNHIVRADYTRIKQVIINLLSNAVKYNSENGIITIRLENSANHTIRISIIDTGKGIELEEQGKLFTAFNRLGAENSEIEGSGIGLVITKNIIDLMGGQIGFESEVGMGSTFWVELPKGSEILDSDNKEVQMSDINVNLNEERTVLYIEDNPANLRLVTQLLSRLPNLHMRSAHEPKLGLELAEEHNPDLILLDINLPGMNGFEVLKLLRQSDVTCNTPVIAISANAMPNDIEKGIEAGFDDYITKPININKLLSIVGEKLTKQ